MNGRWITPGTQLVVLAIFVEPMLCLFYDTRVFPADDRDQFLNWAIMINCVGTWQKFLLLSSTAHFIHQDVWRVPWTSTKDGVVVYCLNTSTRHKSTYCTNIYCLRLDISCLIDKYLKVVILHSKLNKKSYVR